MTLILNRSTKTKYRFHYQRRTIQKLWTVGTKFDDPLHELPGRLNWILYLDRDATPDGTDELGKQIFQTTFTDRFLIMVTADDTLHTILGFSYYHNAKS